MGRFWNGPVFDGGWASVPIKGLPPWTTVSLQTYFFIASGPGTHGPPLSLQPGEPAMASSSPSWYARVVAYLKASFHSGVMYAMRFSTTCGVAKAASKFWNPPRPTRCIHSRSSLMPSLLMFPFIQCHHTSGRALCGGFTKPLFSESAVSGEGSAAVCAIAARPNKAASMMHVVIEILTVLTSRIILFVIVICISYSQCFYKLLSWLTREYIRGIAAFHCWPIVGPFRAPGPICGVMR